MGKLDEDDTEETYRDYEMGMADFLLAVLTGRVEHFPGFTAPDPPVFEGWRAHELRFRQEYPDFRTWNDPLPARWYDA
ncbi:hypothetical protein [Streptacidiphilus sp. MAP12-16]|uniref:hypothetical protein n=1 Tax=Streptacidiphilus sp. MAP12-16 TaxID=3156300 RepID=UPI0035112841